MSNDSFIITVDSREQQNAIKVLEEYKIPYRMMALPTGDYQVESHNTKVVVERKTVTDFIGSLMSGRLEDQMRRLSQEKIPILLITGSFSDYKRYAKNSSFTKDQMVGAIASCVVKYGLRSVIWIQGGNDHPHVTGLVLLSKILQKISQGKLDEVPDRRLKNKDGNQQRELVHLCCGVPSNVAQALLDRFGCPLMVFMAKDEDLLEVKGMGYTRIKKMRELLGVLK